MLRGGHVHFVNQRDFSIIISISLSSTSSFWLLSTGISGSFVQDVAIFRAFRSVCDRYRWRWSTQSCWSDRAKNGELGPKAQSPQWQLSIRSSHNAFMITFVTLSLLLSVVSPKGIVLYETLLNFIINCWMSRHTTERVSALHDQIKQGPRGKPSRILPTP